MAFKKLGFIGSRAYGMWGVKLGVIGFTVLRAYKVVGEHAANKGVV